MRTLTSGQLAVLDGTAYQVGVQLWIADGDGTMRDYLSQGGWNWIDSIEIDVNINQPVSQATINLRRDVIDGSGTVKSLSPLRSDSSLNRNGVGAFAPAIDAGRAIRIMVATTPVGTAPGSGDWQNLFEGTLDDWDIAVNPMVLTARDAGGLLQDTFIWPDGTGQEPNYGSSTGVPIETVMQQILDDALGSGVVTLSCPTSPGYLINLYSQQPQSVMDALQALAGLCGWDVRYCWDEGTSAWRLTLQAIARDNTTPTRTITKARVIDMTQGKLSQIDVRNTVWVWYIDSSTGVSTKVAVADSASIAKYGGPNAIPRVLQVALPQGSPIVTNAEATAYAGYLLADLKDPLLDQIIDMPIDWGVELNDLHQYTANGIHYDTDQALAVVAYTHTISRTQQRTQVECKSAPSGPYLGWLALASTPATAAITPTLDNFRLASETDTDATYEWTNGASTSEVWAAYQIFTSPVPNDPWSIIAAAVLPLGASTFTIPKPPAGSFTYAQIEPRNATLVAGEIQRIVLSPGQPPIDFGASPQGTGAVDNNGNFSVSVDGTQQSLSYKWLVSTSGFPDDAEVEATGTIVNGRQFDLPDVLVLDWGETGYVTAVPYAAPNAMGAAGPSVRVRGSYTTYSGSKTVTFSVAGFTPTNTNTTFGTLANLDLSALSPTNYPDHPIPNPSVEDYALFRLALSPIPSGVTITELIQDLYNMAPSTHPSGEFWGVTYSLYRVTGTTATYLGGNSAADNLGWQSMSTLFSEDTTDNSYYVQTVVSNNAGQPTTDFAFGNVYVTYDMNTPLQTV